MHGHLLSPRTYVLIGLTLVGLTFGTMAISFAPMSGVWHTVIGLTIALTKATLVVLVFMHLWFSDRVTQIVVLAACFWLGLLLVLTLADYFTRGTVPYLPGH
jgi:cytochrome c oxidase subunit 4